MLMTFALVVRGVAAPMTHLDLQSPPAHTALGAVTSDEHAVSNCDQTEIGDAPVSSATVIAHSQSANGTCDPGVPAKTFGKLCDQKGACCGSLAPNGTFETGLALFAVPEPDTARLSVGVQLDSPHRPPRLLSA